MNALIILAFALAPVLAFVGGQILIHKVDAARDRKPETIARNQAKKAEFSAFLQDGETIRAICRTRSKWYSAVTENALITENKTGIHRIPFDQIKKIRFFDITNKKTYTAYYVLSIKLKDADGNRYSLDKYSETMIELARILMEQTTTLQ